jgi:hypothetical protein
MVPQSKRNESRKLFFIPGLPLDKLMEKIVKMKHVWLRPIEERTCNETTFNALNFVLFNYVLGDLYLKIKKEENSGLKTNLRIKDNGL